MHALLIALFLAIPEPSRVDLVGTVQDEQAQALADVLVAAHVGPQSQTIATRTDASGAFKFANFGNEEHTAAQIMLLKPGYGAVQQVVAMDGKTPAPTIKLSPVKPETITLIDPDGNPMADAKVLDLIYFQERKSHGQLHEGILKEFPITVDAGGKMELDVLPAEHDFALTVETPKFGRQRLAFYRAKAERMFRLRAVGSLTGKLVPPANVSAAGLKVVAEVRATDNQTFIGSGSAVSNEDGSFTIPALAAGQAEVRVEAERDKLARPGPPAMMQIAAGKANEVELKLTRAVKVIGTVVDAASGEPIAGAKVTVHNYTTQREHLEVTSNERGEYTALVGGGQIRASIREVPAPYYEFLSLGVNAKSSAEGEELTLPPLRLTRGRSREGNVVDSDGKPVAGAWVTAIWREQQDQYSTVGVRSVQTDAAGNFVLEAVSSVAELYLRAETDNMAAAEYVTVPVAAKEPSRLTLSPAGAAVLAGRVTDGQGQPLAGASVRIHAGYRRPAGKRLFTEGSDLSWNLTTDASGRFATPHPLPRTLENPGELKSYEWGIVRMTVTSPGRIQYHNQVRIGAEGAPFVLPDIVLAKEATVRGRVVDRQGKPVAGASLWAASIQEHRQAQATSGEGGRFELAGIHPQAHFFFAQRDGYAMSGLLIPAETEEAEVILATADEAAKDPPLVHRELSPEDKKAAVLKLLTPLWDQIDIKAHPYRHADILERIAPHDPAYTVKQMQQLTSPRYQVQVLLAMGRTFDAAESAQTIKSPYERSYTLVNIARKIDDDAQRRQQLLGEAMLHGRLAIEPQSRLGCIALVTEALYDAGDKETARSMASELAAEAEKLEAGFYRGYLAETVALFDVDRALKLCEGATDEYERDRHPGNIAHELAAIDPARAQAIIKGLSDRNRYRYVERVCYRMAPVDLARAKQIAEVEGRQGEDQRPHAYGVMALALAKSDPAKAKELLAHACSLLQPEFRGGDTRRQFDQGLALVRLCELVDPTRTRECLWRTASLCPGPAMRLPGSSEFRDKLEADAKLAVLLARYDVHPEIAAKLIEPVFTTDKVELYELRERVFPFAMGLVDPERASKWLTEYMKKAPPEWLPNTDQPWHYMADAVGQDDAGFWRTLQGSILHQWIVDDED